GGGTAGGKRRAPGARGAGGFGRAAPRGPPLARIVHRRLPRCFFPFPPLPLPGAWPFWCPLATGFGAGATTGFGPATGLGVRAGIDTAAAVEVEVGAMGTRRGAPAPDPRRVRPPPTLHHLL